MSSKQKRVLNLNIRFSETGKYLMTELQEHLGLSQASIVEMLLRDEARRRGIVIPGSGAHLAQLEEQQEAAKRITQEALAKRGYGLD